MWRNLRKLPIRKPKNGPDSSLLPFGSRESHRAPHANHFMGLDPKSSLETGVPFVRSS
jgi:hypothetical protein